MGLKRKTAAAAVLLCCSVLAKVTVGCPHGWRQYGDNCYRLTATKLRQDQLTDTCQRMGGAAVSIHSKEENDFVASVARGNYVWLGMRLISPNRKQTWEDGSRYSYQKFLPAGNRMLKRSFTGAGILQQSCKRWNYDRVSRELHGVCKMSNQRPQPETGARTQTTTAAPAPIFRCPEGALKHAAFCYLVSSQQVPWWEAEMACSETDQRAVPTNLKLQDYQLTSNVTGHFGGATKLIIGVDYADGERTMDSCSSITLQYGQRSSDSCEFGCAEMLPVLCKRPESLDRGSAEPAEPIRMMPPMYRGGDAAPVRSASGCPSGWAARGRRCVSELTPAASRGWAEALCQHRDSSRLAAVRHDNSIPLLAKQIQGVNQAWVRDERPDTLDSLLAQNKVQARFAALVRPEYNVLTADGQMMRRPQEEELPAICELCQQACGPNAMAFGGHCYRLLEEDRTLTNATRSCAELEGAMVSIESAPENRFVTALAFAPSSAQCSQPDGGVWLGLQRVRAGSSWEWEDCNEFSFDNWASDAGNDGQCAILSRDGLWKDATRCNQLRLPTVCEWDPCEEPGRYGGDCQLSNPGAVY